MKPPCGCALGVDLDPIQSCTKIQRPGFAQRALLDQE